MQGAVPVSVTSVRVSRKSGVWRLPSQSIVLRGVSSGRFFTVVAFAHRRVPSFMALTWQFSTHSPQATHLSMSTRAT